MIDTNELRNTGVDNDGYAQVKETEFLSMLDELDRLYELERRNAPLTREEIEAELVRRGWLSTWGGRIYRHEKQSHTVVFECYVLVFWTHSIPLSAVTLQLLDAVLEGK